MAVIAVQLRDASRRHDLQAFLDTMDTLGFAKNHPIYVQVNGTIEATMATTSALSEHTSTVEA